MNLWVCLTEEKIQYSLQPHFLSGVAYNGIEKIDVKGKDILIIGAGAIGLLGAACAKAIGEY